MIMGVSARKDTTNSITPNLFGGEICLLNFVKVWITLTEVDIYRISGGIFYSHLFIERDGNTSFITCRTSDAIALAVRNNTPIYIEEDLLERNREAEPAVYD